MATFASPRPTWANLPGIGPDHEPRRLFTINPSPDLKGPFIWSEENGVFIPRICVNFAPAGPPGEPSIAEFSDGTCIVGFVPYEPKSLEALREIRRFYIAKMPRTHQIEMILAALHLDEDRFRT